MKIIVLLVACFIALIECRATFSDVNRGCIIGYLKNKNILGAALRDELAAPNCRDVVSELVDSIYANISQQIKDDTENLKNPECYLNLLQRYDVADVILKESLFEEGTSQQVVLEKIVEKMTENAENLCTEIGVTNIVSNFQHIMNEHCFAEDWQDLEMRYCFRKHISSIKILDCKVNLNSDNIDISNIDCDLMMENFKTKSRADYRKKLLLDPSMFGNLGKINCAMKVNEKAYFYDRHLAISMLQEQHPTEEEVAEAKESYFDMMTDVTTNRMSCIKLGFENL
ncbi:unnamed protein product [Diamesa serratosioi]